MVRWPTELDALAALQRALARAAPEVFTPGTDPAVGGVFVCFPHGSSGIGGAGDPGWAGAAVVRGGRVIATASVAGRAAAAYAAGYLAAREGALLAAAVEALPEPPDVLLVNASGRDHPRRAGLALHLGAYLDLPTIGVTHRPLIATGAWPADVVGATSPLVVDGEVVALWLRTRARARPVVVHPAWRTAAQVALDVVSGVAGRARTPLPLRAARQIAREARALGEGRALGPAGPLA